MHLDDATAVGHGDFEKITVDVNAFSPSGKVAKSLHDQSANRVHFFVAELRAEYLVEIFNRGQSRTV